MGEHSSPHLVGTANRTDVVKLVHFGRVDEWPTETVPIAMLSPADSPRLAGENHEHVLRLAELGGKTPPIIVHRPTMRVVDGMHRLQAALMCGLNTIDVRFFDGDPRNILVLALELNVRHGLPLSRNDRVAAATRVMCSHPEWSDQMIAELVGLSGKTVAAIRSRSTSDIPLLNGRLGRDGKVRPLDTSHARRLAGRLMAERPEASLREIAREAGISLGTAQDVRKRLRIGVDPVPRKQDNALAGAQSSPLLPVPRRSADDASTRDDSLALLRRLKDDPSLRLTESGRKLLRLLDILSVPPDLWSQVAMSVPAYCASTVASLAERCAEHYMRFADQVAQQPSASRSP